MRLPVSGVGMLVDMDSHVCLSHPIVSPVPDWIIFGEMHALCIRWCCRRRPNEAVARWSLPKADPDLSGGNRI
jgi:hypothetical protein